MAWIENAELDSSLKELEFELIEEGEQFTILPKFNLTSKSLVGAYFAIVAGVFFWVMTFFYSEGQSNLWYGSIGGLVAISIGGLLIWLQKSQYLIVSFEEVRFRQVFKHRVIRLKPGLKLKTDYETHRDTKKGVTREYIYADISIGKGKEKQVIFSLDADIAQANHVEELINGLAWIIKQRIKRLEVGSRS